MKISFEHIGEVVASFPSQDTLKIGQVCKITDSGEVGICSENDRFCGTVQAMKDHLVALQVRGFTSVAYSESMQVGWVKLSADGLGGVKADNTNGAEYLVVQVDSSNKIAAVLL